MYSGQVLGFKHGNYYSASALKSLRGYLVYITDPGTVTVGGAPPVTDAGEKIIVDGEGNVSVMLDQGWNLFGPKSPVTITYPLPAPLDGTIWWWNGNSYQAADQLEPHNAYWIYSQEDNVEFPLSTVQ